MDDPLAVLRIALADRYTVEREIGRGGMATVYLAEELHPRRKVAIKVLTPDIATRILRERFLREVNVASKLSHPHIVPVFAAGEADGLLYFVMPFIDGQSLRQRMVRHGPLSIREACAITRDVAGALNYAHGLGVIHRDIKPENILIMGDHALVADFGIARALGVAGGQSLTQAGLAIGTPAYMSPEQASGLREIDGRSDVYSLGCVLHEMLGGARQAKTPDARLHTVKDTVRTIEGAASTRDGVAAVLRKALAVDPIDRFLTAAAFRDALEDLRQVGSAATPRKRALGIAALVGGAAVILAFLSGVLIPQRGGATTPDRVVVAMFENQTGDPGLAHIGPMAADWITQGLAQTGLLDVVVARGQLAEDDAVESTDARLRALAEESDAEIVVSGAYYRQGDELQFQTRLTDPREGQVLLSLSPVVAHVDSPLVGVEVLRERVMGALASLVDPRIASSARAFSEPPSYEAYQQYVEGMTAFMQLDIGGAIQRFLRAAEVDSTFASARLFAAFAFGTAEQWEQADSLAQIVNRSRDALAPLDRHELDWVLAMAQGDLLTGLAAIRAAAEIAGAEARLLHGITALWANRPQEALDALLRLDPQRGFTGEFFLYWNLLSSVLHALGRHEEELEQARRGRAQYPNLRSTVGAELRALVTLGEGEPLDSLWALYDSLPLQETLQRHSGDLMRLGALEATAHGHDDIAGDHVQRLLDWYESLAPAEAAQEVHRYGLARGLYGAGNYQGAKELFDQLVIEQPDSIGYWGYLAAVAARMGNDGEARRISESLGALDRPYLHGAATFWRARIASVLGDFETAVAYLHQADAEGRFFDGDEDFLVDLQPLKEYPPFQDWLRPRG